MLKLRTKLSSVISPRECRGVVAAHGGRFVVRSGTIEVVQGDWKPQRIAVVEFDDVEKARAWQDSPDYAELREMLNKCGNANVIIVEGYD